MFLLASTFLTLSLASVPSPAPAHVVRVIDGDSILVALDGVNREVRYIGINTPEYDEPCGKQAKNANKRLVAGQTVRLVRDESESDKYGRLLRYVYIGDRFINAELVAQGYAVATSFEPDMRYADDFERLEKQARVDGVGCYSLPFLR